MSHGSRAGRDAAPTEHLGAGRWVDARTFPDGTVEQTYEVPTADGAKVSGVLRTVPGARTIVAISHPRQDVTHHVLVPELLSRGFAVWTQGTRSPNNDIALLHEQALLDIGAGLGRLRDLGWENVVTLGHSGGGTLFAYYFEQSGLPAGERIARGPSGRPSGLPDAALTVPDGAVFLAPHPGQGALLLRMIDPSVSDEDDPMSVDPTLDPYSPANGFASPGEPSHYDVEFVERYRAAQRARIERLDAVARERAGEAADARKAFKASGALLDRRRSLAPRILTVYRTDADLRCVDPSIDPNDRPYGSVFGRRPDLTNYGLVGFGRIATPDAWLSTWSGLSSNADFLRCAPAVTVPTLLCELTGDQACFPSDGDAMGAALGATDLTRERVAGTHFGGPLREGGPTGADLAAERIGPWLAERFPTGRRR
jgi:hypothetical protein